MLAETSILYSLGPFVYCMKSICILFIILLALMTTITQCEATEFGIIVVAPDSKPSMPSGTTSGTPGTSYSYSTSAIDPDRDQVKYTFDWGDGTAQSQTGFVNSGTIASTSHTWSKAGTYRVKATATTNQGDLGWSDPLVVTITANSPPNKPSMPSGTTSGTSGTSYSYSTSAIDPDRDQVKYTFDWGDGTAQSQTGFVNSGTIASTSHTWSKAGTYRVKATATTNQGDLGWSDPLVVTITANSPPNKPSMPSGTTSGTSGTSYSYSTSAIDPDRDQVKYTFDWGDGTAQSQTGFVNSGTIASTSHTWSKAGTYQVKAMATDSRGAISGWSDPLVVTITANSPPNKPSMPSGTTSGTSGTSYSYSISAIDPDRDQVKYTFDWGDGTAQSQTGFVNSGTIASTSHTWSKAGTYQVKAMATDSRGAISGWSDPLVVTITANSPPNAPSRPAGFALGKIGTLYSYSTYAIDPERNQIQYTFDWGDGMTNLTGLVSSGIRAALSHKWSKTGRYQVKAMATDSKGVASGWSDPLVVTVAPNNPPNAPSRPTGFALGKIGTLYSYSTHATDPERNQIQYTFDWGDGTTKVTGLVSSGIRAALSHKWSKAGTYQVKALATDSKGASSGYSAILAVRIL